MLRSTRYGVVHWCHMKCFQMTPNLSKNARTKGHFSTAHVFTAAKSFSVHYKLPSKSHLFVLFLQQRAELIDPAHHAVLFVVHGLHKGIAHVGHQQTEAEEGVSLGFEVPTSKNPGNGTAKSVSLFRRDTSA